MGVEFEVSESSLAQIFGPSREGIFFERLGDEKDWE